MLEFKQQPGEFGGVVYTARVWPDGVEYLPSLPFLHKGDIYEDIDGTEYVIVKASLCRGNEDEGRVHYYHYVADRVTRESDAWGS